MTVRNRELLVIYKPDGLPRTCTDQERQRVLTAWISLLTWLQGADPDALPESKVLGHIAGKAALRTPRFPDYDVRIWTQQAAGLPHRPSIPQHSDALHAVGTTLFTSIGLQQTSEKRCRLNRVAIELLYGDAASFQQARERWVPPLLDGPVLIERWTGHRLELALAVKFLLRNILSAEPITNLLHIEITTPDHTATIEKAVSTPVISQPARPQRPHCE